MNPIDIVSLKTRVVMAYGGLQAPEVEVFLADGTRASALGGSIRGDAEPLVRLANEKLADELFSRPADQQLQIDILLRELDGTANLSHLRKEILFPVSMAVSKAAAAHYGMPLYRYLGGVDTSSLPIPMISIVHGEDEGNPWTLSLLPFNFSTFSTALKECQKIIGRLRLSTGESTREKNCEGQIEILRNILRESEYTSAIEICLETKSPDVKTVRARKNLRSSEAFVRTIKSGEIFDVGSLGTVSDLFALVDSKKRDAILDVGHGVHCCENFLADFSVAAKLRRLKLDSLTNGKNLNLVNRFFEIENDLGTEARYTGQKTRG